MYAREAHEVPRLIKHRAQLINIQRRGRRKEEEEEERTARTPDGRDSRDLGRARDHQMLFASLSFRDGDGGSRQGDRSGTRAARAGAGKAKRGTATRRSATDRPLRLLWRGRGDGSGAKRFGCKARWILFAPHLRRES